MVDGQVQRGDKMYDAKIQHINETVAGKVKQAGETQSQQRQFSRGIGTILLVRQQAII